MPFVTRFAPSPTGPLHLGHAFSALTAFDAARAAGGRFLLRMEDLDEGRARAAFEAGAYEDLAWLGLSWETPVHRQSDHLGEYAGVLRRLIDRGLVYRCFKTRREVMAALAEAPHERGALYFGAPLAAEEEIERLERGEPFAWRLSIARACEALGPRADRLSFVDEAGEHPVEPARLGDAVLARKDFPASYHLASVWDDALQGVTDVIRGEDLRDSAHLHGLLQALLDLPAPRYRHHRLIVDAAGRRLAKRDKDETLASLRVRGVTPAEIRAQLGLALDD
ncbi:MAG: tRNA glutamyl-Q(34) synthetase GluQRS [Hyphomonadaceae bacterium]